MISFRSNCSPRRLFRIIPFLFGVSALVPHAQSLHAQPLAWQQTAGPPNGPVRTAVEQPSSAFLIVGANRIQSSRDGGLTWTAAFTTLSSSWLNELAITSDGTMLAAFFGSELAGSVDGGATWSLSASAPPIDVSSSCLTSRGSWLCGSFGEGVARSVDEGRTWTRPLLPPQVGSPSNRGVVYVIRCDAAGVCYAATWRGLVSSIDDGATWVLIDSVRFNASFINLATTRWGTMYAMSGDTVLASEDHGATWGVRSNLGFNAFGLSASSRALYATANEGVLRSIDSGRTWVPVDTGATWPRLVGVTAEDHIFIDSDTGLVRSTDGGVTRERVGEACVTSDVSMLASDSAGTILTGGARGVHRTTDLGATWARVVPPRSFGRVYSLAASLGGHVFVGTDSGLLVSHDAGAIWQRKHPAADVGTYAATAVVTRPDGLVYVEYNGVTAARSMDFGETWEAIHHDYLGPAPHDVALVGDSLVCLTAGSTVSRSTDRGATWAWSSVGTSPPLHVTANRNGTIFAANRYSLFASNDGGVTWHDVAIGGLPRFTNLGVLCTAGNRLIVYYDTVAQVSDDEGLTWRPLVRGLPALLQSVIEGNDGHLYAGTAGWGMLRSEAVSAVPPRPGPAAAASCRLRRDGDRAMLDCTTSLPGDLRVAIVDAAGRCVRTVTHAAQGSGAQEVTLDLAGLASGYYHCVVDGGGVHSVLALPLVR